MHSARRQVCRPQAEEGKQRKGERLRAKDQLYLFVELGKQMLLLEERYGNWACTRRPSAGLRSVGLLQEAYCGLV